jgi:hypothetical protein
MATSNILKLSKKAVVCTSALLSKIHEKYVYYVIASMKIKVYKTHDWIFEPYLWSHEPFLSHDAQCEVPVTKPSPFIVFCIVSNTINVYCP